MNPQLSHKAEKVLLCACLALAAAPQAAAVEWSSFMSMPLVNPVYAYGQDAPTMVFDEDGVWHMGYCYSDGGAYHLTYLNALGETYDIVTKTDNYVSCPCFALDPAGNLHAVYRSGGGSIWYTHNTSGSWTEWTEPVQLVPPVHTWALADAPTFVFDAQGVWHMVYVWCDAEGYCHTTYMNSEEEQFDLPTFGYHPTIAIDPSGTIQMVMRGDGGSLWYTPDIMEPASMLVPPVNAWVGGPRAVIDKDGVGHMVYGWTAQNGPTYITYINSLGESCNIATGDVRCPEIAIEPNGALYVICRGAGGSIGKAATPAKADEAQKICTFRIKNMFSNPEEGQGPDFAAKAPETSESCATLFSSLGWTKWMDLDIQGIESVIDGAKTLPGDGIPDALQLATVEAVLCNAGDPRRDFVMEQFLLNKTILRDDLAWLCKNVSQNLRPLYADIDLLAMLLGISEEMQTSVDALVREMAGGPLGLQRLNEYAVFGMSAAKPDALPPFSADGDLDQDGLTNLEEYLQVVDYGATPLTYVRIALDPTNLWAGNPDAHAVTLPGLVVLAVLLALIAVKKRQSCRTE